MNLVTTLGGLAMDDLGQVLPHEHVVADFRALREREPRSAHPVRAISSLIEPEVLQALSRGVTAIVDATPVGIGRRPDAVEAISTATGMPFCMATGVYREPWIPGWIRDLSYTELVDWLMTELTDRVVGGSVPAGWIKLSASDDGMAPEERRILRAAARAGQLAGAAIGSHSTGADLVEAQLDLLESEGFPADRFIWIHAQLEPDRNRHRALAQRGCWIEYDGVGVWPRLEEYVSLISDLADDGFADRILVSQDAGWYNPGDPGGGLVNGPYTRVHDQLIPLMRRSGFDDDLVHQIWTKNPFLAFARQ
ncbi:phosphotriesterase [Pseudolysinimonas yzui]|uniref:Phosphotriesterase n=1 Tax=Pseudolysinimonas yzui TaxID=2708254 RepID=A0A8J3GTI9_9MICO|nr:esterase [Pseudolysinimonas yzui]GHF26621.1 phosphotriesterase [Pseudolysinimonas yzui]